MNWYKNKRISTKLIIGFLVVALIAVIVGGVGVINLTSMEKSATILYEQNALGLQYSGSAATAFQMVRYNTLRVTTYDTKQEVLDGITNITNLNTQLEEFLADLDQVIYSEEGRGHLNTIKEEWNNYKVAQQQVMSYASASNGGLALKTLEEKLSPVGVTVRESFISLMEVVSTNAELRAKDNSALAQTSILIMVIVAVVGLVVSILLGAYIARMIGNPLKKMAEAADKLAVGDVDIEMNADSKDEIGKLAEAFKQLIASTKVQVAATQRVADGDLTVEMQIRSEKDVLGRGLSELVANLNDLVVSIISSSEQVSSGANLVSNSSMTLSQGATEQASSVQQLTASLQEIASQTTLNANNAQKANDLAQNAKSDAEQGNAQMQDMLNAMEEINHSSSSINKIIKVIDDIAFQTNILALNAAVEAARAGQHGKGFAVVAEEVRTLAARSAQAAKETTDLIEGSIKKVEAGTKIANSTATALGKIVNEVASAADLVDSIAIASNAQASAIEQINQGILQVSQVVQNNAATSEESAAASEELSSQADQLNEIVSTFKVKQGLGAKNFGNHTTAERKSPAKALNAAGPQKKNISLSGGDFGKY